MTLRGNDTKSIRKIKLENYRNYMKYAYKTREIRQFIKSYSLKSKKHVQKRME